MEVRTMKTGRGEKEFKEQQEGVGNGERGREGEK